MDAEDAPSAEMRHPLPNDPLALDDASVDRLLSGTLPADGAPPGYAGVARLLAATVAPPTPRELAGEAAVLAELRAVTRERRAAASVRPARHRRRRAGLAVVVVVGALATGGVAAAPGHRPGPVREAARSVLGPAGVATSPAPAPSVAPGTATAGSGGTGPGGSASTVGPGPRSGPAAAGPAAGPALDGLCQAFLEGKGGDHGGKLDAVAFKELAAAAGGDDRVKVFCEELLAADVQVKGPKESKPKDPPDAGHGQGGPPPTTGGAGSGSGTGGGGGGGQDGGGQATASSSSGRTLARTALDRG
jgi:hypothetical protein